MNTPNITRLKKWSTNGAILGLVAAFLNLAGLGGGGYESILILNLARIFGSVLGGAFLGLLAAAITNSLTRRN